MKPIILEPREVHIHADRRLVFQTMSAFGNDGLKDSRSKVLEDHGECKLVEFHTPMNVRGKQHIVRSVEWVQLKEHERIDFSLAHPNPEDKIFALSVLENSFLFGEAGGCTLFRYESKYALKAPIIGWPIARFMMKNVMDNHMDEHVLEIKELCEARAARSHVFPQQPCDEARSATD